MIHRFVLKNPDVLGVASQGKRLDIPTLTVHEPFDEASSTPIPGYLQLEVTAREPEVTRFELVLFVDDTRATPELMTLIQQACEETSRDDD